MSKIGYIRVSSIEQNTDRQEIALSDIGMDKIFIEKVSVASSVTSFPRKGTGYHPNFVELAE